MRSNYLGFAVSEWVAKTPPAYGNQIDLLCFCKVPTDSVAICCVFVVSEWVGDSASIWEPLVFVCFYNVPIDSVANCYVLSRPSSLGDSAGKQSPILFSSLCKVLIDYVAICCVFDVSEVILSFSSIRGATDTPRVLPILRGDGTDTLEKYRYSKRW